MKSSKQWSLTIKLIVLLMLRCCSSNWTFAPQFWQGDVISTAIITSSDLRSKCWIWGAAQQFEQYNNVDGHWSLFTGFHYNFLSSPHFWHLLLNSDIGPPDEKNVAFEGVKPPQKQPIFFCGFLIHIQNTFCKKIGQKRSFRPSAVAKKIYIQLYGVATTN